MPYTIPGAPFVVVPPEGTFDLTEEFPSLQSINARDLVGGKAPNRQPLALRTRTLTLRDRVNKLTAAINSINTGVSGGFAFAPRDGSVEFTGDIGFGGHLPSNLGAPTDPNHATRKTYVDAADANLQAQITAIVSGTGSLKRDGTLAMTGPLNFGTYKAINLGNPVDPADAVNLQTMAAADTALQTQIDALALSDNLSLRSPYSRNTLLPDRAQAGGLGGAPLTTITPGGVLRCTTLTITVPMVLTVDTFIYADGDVLFNSTVTAAGKRLEVQCTGSIGINAALAAGDIRLRAVGDITGAGTLTASGLGGVVSVDSLAAVNLAGAINAPLVFIYAGADSVISSAITAQVGSSSVVGGGGLQWGLDFGRNAASPVLSTADPFWDNFDIDYLTKYAGRPSTYAAGTGGQAGAGGAGGGGRGGDHTSGGSRYGVSPEPGALQPWMLPAAPGGAGSGTSTGRRGGDGGGVILVQVNAALDLTGAVLLATAGNGTGSASSYAYGGGGGGTVKVAARDGITNGTARANGGPGGTGSSVNDGRPGGGGVSFMVSTAFTGVNTTEAAAGPNGATGAGGATAGQAGSVTLTEDEWDAMYNAGVFAR